MSTWTTREGETLKIVNMTTRHLVNTIKFLKRHEQVLQKVEMANIADFDYKETGMTGTGLRLAFIRRKLQQMKKELKERKEFNS